MRTVPGSVTNPYEADVTKWVDQHVAALLGRVGHWPFRKVAAYELLEINPPRRWSQQVPQLRLTHTVSEIQSTIIIDENRPGNASLLNVCTDGTLGFKRHNNDLNPKVSQRLVNLLQLQQMATAGQSTQVAMEDHE